MEEFSCKVFTPSCNYGINVCWAMLYFLEEFIVFFHFIINLQCLLLIKQKPGKEGLNQGNCLHMKVNFDVQIFAFLQNKLISNKNNSYIIISLARTCMVMYLHLFWKKRIGLDFCFLHFEPKRDKNQ